MIAAHYPVLEMLGQIVFFLVVGIAVIFGALRQGRERRERVSGLFALGNRLKFESFNPGRDDSFILGWGFLKRLSEGDDRYAFNILRGTYRDMPIYVFDFHYGTGSGKSREEHYGTMLMFVVKEAFPQLTIKPESFGQRIAAAIGLGHDIQFESVEFSKAFSVQSVDKKFAYDVCNPQMMEYLLANRDLQIEIQGPVISMAFEPQLPVTRIEFNLQRLAQIRSLLPEYLFTHA